MGKNFRTANGESKPYFSPDLAA